MEQSKEGEDHLFTYLEILKGQLAVEGLEGLNEILERYFENEAR